MAKREAYSLKRVVASAKVRREELRYKLRSLEAEILFGEKQLKEKSRKSRKPV